MNAAASPPMCDRTGRWCGFTAPASARCWPRRLPMMLINGRMSQRSFPRWRRISATIEALLGCFDVCLAQSDLDAERFTALGSRNVVTTGNLKLDLQAPPADHARLERLMAVTRGRPVVVAASTHPG